MPIARQSINKNLPTIQTFGRKRENREALRTALVMKQPWLRFRVMDFIKTLNEKLLKGLVRWHSS